MQVAEKVYHNRETEEEKEQRKRKEENEREMKKKVTGKGIYSFGRGKTRTSGVKEAELTTREYPYMAQVVRVKEMGLYNPSLLPLLRVGITTLKCRHSTHSR